MPLNISLNCSSFVASQCGHHPDSQWGTCVQAVNDFYQPIDTFAERFERLIQEIKTLGYSALDIWTAGQLNWAWATAEHRQIASQLLKQYDMTVTSIGGAFGVNRDEFLDACQLALDLGTDLLSGTTALLFSDREFVIQTLKAKDLRLGIENHPEKTPAAMLAQIGDDSDGRIGTTIDTGWYATQGFSVPRAVKELEGFIFHVHLKDVLPPKDIDDHINCGYGKGCVQLEETVQMLQQVGYSGDYSIENHCLDHDPSAELVEALALLQDWLGK